MIVTLINKASINSITLPEKIRGQYWIYDSNDWSKKLIGIEGINGEWILKSNKDVKVMDHSGKPIRNTVLSPLSIYNLDTQEQDNKTIVFIEPSTDDRQTFTKYLVDKDTDITIGRTDKNDIILNNHFVSASHAKLSFRSGKWSITDLNSTNGTFVGGDRVKSRDLKIGDMIYIMGYKLIVGSFFVAVNNPDGTLSLKSNFLKPFINQQAVIPDEEEEYEAPAMDYFYRSPRFKRDVEKAVIKIDSPPPNAIGEEMPLMLVLGPSVTMGMASMATALFAINNAMATGDYSRAMPSIMMSSSMLLGTILWPILSKKYDRRRRRKKEKVRQEKYKEYLDKIAVMFNEESEKQEEILRENHVPITDLISRIKHVSRDLWERGLGQNDFLKVRVGTGSGTIAADITYSEKKFSIDDDNLEEELYTLVEAPKVLKNIPITLSLFENNISGVIGNRKQTVEFTKGLIFQVAAMYSYDEVKMVFVYDQEEEDEFGFTKWLPHVWSNDNKFRFIATNNNEVKEVSAYIEKEIEVRAGTNDSEMEDVKPYYIVFAMSRQLAVRAEMLKQVYSKKKNIHISVVTFYDELQNLPKECTMVVQLDENSGILFDKNDITGKSTSFVPDIFVTDDPNELSVKLANVPLDTLASSFNLPKMVTFLELFGVGKVEHLNALTRWRDNDPTKSLEAAVGVDTLGELFKLDLHEKFHGPHGLVAGMTGSGKSEFIIAYILSLAVNYHPNEVAFILIDYKGGGMAKSFENLPHTAGIITNLDGAAIKRSLISIESELKRRQAIFAEASKQVGESNIDIYKYQKLYREGVVREPLQHLFIISDEFAELKTQQPEFMAQLVSAARIGRSLGIHLILATQKPSGVVDDQIWSNSKFRVSLKVQERADSMDMLKRPDAAELTDTGRFYLQVGYNELFEMGQSAWAGAPYYPSDKVVVEKDNSVVVIDRNGRPIKQAKLDKKKSLFANPKKQMDVITDYLRNIAAEEQIKIRPLWLEPIPAMILLNDVTKKYKADHTNSFVLNPVIGEYDDPARQQQCLLRLPLSEEGNTIVYGVAGSGKTTFLNTMVYSLMQEHTPDEVNIYILDFASETLRAFAKAPHVGDVILSYESEKISNLFKLLQSEVEGRKKLFADYGGDHASYMNATGEKVPSIVVAINNFAAFTEIYEEKETAVSFLSREGTKYGIYFVLTALGTNAVRFRLLQNFKQLLTLQLNDETDYSTVVGKTDGLYPSKFKGRGLVKRDAIYEFQVAHITDEPVPYPFIQRESMKLHAAWKGNTAKKIPILPDVVDMEFLGDYVSPNGSLTIPMGVEKSSLNVHYYPFGKAYINMILSASSEHLGFTHELARFMAQKCGFDVTVIDGQQSFINKNNKDITYYSTVKEFENVVASMFDLVVYRNNTYKEAIEKGIEVEHFDQKVIIIHSVVALKNALSKEGEEKLGLILLKGEAKYNITIVFAEQSKNLSGITFDKWYKQHINPGDGIWVGSGITEQYNLKPLKTTAELREDMTAQFGFSLQKGKSVKVKLLNSEKENEDNDE
ncbi:type VII secretion protein EssC [Bacillus sp. OK048]|uniref:type VII secretion protein EssC n=1 Tax=Bacillus sp. OK048 TaxID=1882761 RepID=UPI000891BE8F|nr:type VII secretion protein EssC [Bacillus sp. OK048]SDM84863.1 DNA segregation ATPase FtsK/SpoIIIE, S-DNA-T family [Bacillus sp. OK048]